MKKFFSQHGKNKILIHVPTKKQYLGNMGLFKNQPAQKGGTCWYYVLNYLRVRYGPDFTNQEHPERKVEKTISLFRKNIVAIENLTAEFFASLESLQFEYQVEEINKTVVEKRLKFNQYMREDIGEPFKELETELLKKFLNQGDFTNLAKFINDSILLKYINNACHCLAELSVNVGNALQQYLKEQSNLKLANLTLKDKFKIFQNLVFLEAIKQYHLKISAWQPNYTINYLINLLAQEGPLAVSGYFNFKNDFLPDFDNNKMGERPLYFLEEPIIDDEEIGHAVLIVGAEITDRGEWIYYLDPNDSTETSKIYKIAYHHLNQITADIYGNIYSELKQTINIPFAICADDRLLPQEDNLSSQKISLNWG